jgi:(S)-ureidoglycine aminohydrolase
MHNLGQTRSASHRDHLLHTPDTFIRTPLPGLTNGLTIVHASPQCGAAFTQMTIELAPSGTLTEGPTQRLLYVLEGKLTLSEPGTRKLHKLKPGSYAYLPTDHPHTLTALSPSRIVVIDKPFLPLESEPNPAPIIAHELDAPATPLNGDPDLIVRSLLPTSLAFDFAVNTMTYAPGASLSQVEVHTMEHGLLMLEGGGIYRLNDHWYPTTAGDAIWMAPFCPQWFGAIGKTPAKYLIYKDFNRHPLG